LRRRAHFDEAIQEELHAEIGDGAPEKDGRNLAAQHRIAVEGRAGPVEQLDAFAKFRIRLFVNQRAQALVVGAGHAFGRAGRAVGAALEEMHFAGLPVVDAFKGRAAAERPIHREGTNAKHALEFVQ